MERFNRFLYGFAGGILLPALFMWIYLIQVYPHYEGLGVALEAIYPSILFGKILLLSVFPNLLLMFLFYRADSFRLATGVLGGGMPYFIASVFIIYVVN